jgi:hypothetical protein
VDLQKLEEEVEDKDEDVVGEIIRMLKTMLLL